MAIYILILTNLRVRFAHFLSEQSTDLIEFKLEFFKSKIFEF